jgi:hypothetical protein
MASSTAGWTRRDEAEIRRARAAADAARDARRKAQQAAAEAEEKKRRGGAVVQELTWCPAGPGGGHWVPVEDMVSRKHKIIPGLLPPTPTKTCAEHRARKNASAARRRERAWRDRRCVVCAAPLPYWRDEWRCVDCGKRAGLTAVRRMQRSNALIKQDVEEFWREVRARRAVRAANTAVAAERPTALGVLAVWQKRAILGEAALTPEDRALLRAANPIEQLD